MTIDRIDNDKGYFPGNLRWATQAQQLQNRRPLIDPATGKYVKGADPEFLKPKFFKPVELAHLLNVSHQAIRTWIFDRRIPVIRFGRAVRIKIEVAEKILRDGLPKHPTKGED